MTLSQWLVDPFRIQLEQSDFTDYSTVSFVLATLAILSEWESRLLFERPPLRHLRGKHSKPNTLEGFQGGCCGMHVPGLFNANPSTRWGISAVLQAPHIRLPWVGLWNLLNTSISTVCKNLLSCCIHLAPAQRQLAEGYIYLLSHSIIALHASQHT